MRCAITGSRHAARRSSTQSRQLPRRMMSSTAAGVNPPGVKMAMLHNAQGHDRAKHIHWQDSSSRSLVLVVWGAVILRRWRHE
jgi:hypothetical protein